MNSRRTALRFPLELPALLRWEEGDRICTLQTQTKNLSSSGMYLLVGPQHQPASSIEFEVQLPAEMAGGAVLRGKGRLVRREQLTNERVGLAAVIDQYEFSSNSPANGERV